MPMPLDRVPDTGKEGYRSLTPISGTTYQVAYADDATEEGTVINRTYLIKNESRNVIYSLSYDSGVAVGDCVKWDSTGSEWITAQDGEGIVEEIFLDSLTSTNYIAIVTDGAITLSGLTAGSLYYVQTDWIVRNHRNYI